MRILKLPTIIKIWSIILLPLSGFIRIAVQLLPFRFFSVALGRHYHNIQFTPLVDAQQQALACQIGWTIERLAYHTPWQTRCLEQALMARILLGYYGIPYIIHFGLTNLASTPGSMQAHAWVIVGREIITGKKGHHKFQIVGTFIQPGLVKYSHCETKTVESLQIRFR